MGALDGLWYVGILLEVISTMSGTVGKQLIRLGEVRKRSNPALARSATIAGLVTNTVLGPFVDMAAYSFAPQSLIAPFGGLDVVWNAALAPFTLNEQLTMGRVAGCILIVIGTVMAGAFGNHTDPEFSIDYLEDTLVNVRVLIYFSVFMAWFFVNRFVLMKFPTGSAVRGVSLGCTAGTIAGNMFCVKAAIELIQRSIHEQEGEIWLHWLVYVLLLGAVFFALTNVVYMTKGLQEYEALFMVTIYEGSMIVSGCVSGAIVLMDMRGVEAWRVGLYFLGVATIMIGMYVIFREESRSSSSLIAGKASIASEDGEAALEVSGEGSAARPRGGSFDAAALTKRSPHAKKDLYFESEGSPRRNSEPTRKEAVGRAPTDPPPQPVARATSAPACVAEKDKLGSDACGAVDKAQVVESKDSDPAKVVSI